MNPSQLWYEVGYETLPTEDNDRTLLKENTVEPTTNQILCKDGYPAITRDGVTVDPQGTYWCVPTLEAKHFSGLHRGKIPNLGFTVSGQEIIDSGRPWGYTSTREEANHVAVELYLRKMELQIESAKRELNLLEQSHRKIQDRLAIYQADSKTVASVVVIA